MVLGVMIASSLVLAACSSGPKAAIKQPAARSTTTTTTTTTTAPSGSTTTTAAGASAAPCTGSALKGTEPSFGAAAGGAADVSVALTNRSSSACSLNGYPQLQLVSSKGQDLTTTVENGGSGIPSKFSLGTVNLAASGGQASFMLYWVATPSSSEPDCTLAPKKAISMAAEINACGGIIEASPFQPGVLQVP